MSRYKRYVPERGQTLKDPTSKKDQVALRYITSLFTPCSARESVTSLLLLE